MNPTLARFGYPASRVAEYEYWTVLLRPDQLTLGSLILATTTDARAFGALEAPAFEELRSVVGDIERHLKRLFAYDTINYIMLMINDPNPHFHVVPRYREPRAFAGREFPDVSWPLPPDFSTQLEMTGAEKESLHRLLIEAWQQGAA